MRILLVEDNPDLGDAVESKLRNAGHSVQWVRDGLAAVQWGQAEPWDALLLDISLPGKDGDAVLRELRAAGMESPVLVMTARAEIEDKVDMLDLGADDYLVKPFDLRELEARLRALMRRPGGQTSSVAMFGNLTLDSANRGVWVNGQPLELGRREFRLLEILLTRQGQTVAKERLMAQVFDADDVSLNALELLISRLRRKLADASVDIVTVRGVGYQVRQDGAA
ncbi:response regulator transcription factor [Bordetella avium]|uniref:Two-component response regulator n=2 Tax=Bordetella avium TaxID=521 RepID=Q2L1Q6_BORA1|nr:response regulator transcription factor [Bordetella avium]AZY47776.1 DNA-binding response regulator [Bordetella avium]AZY51147.1 DNA-binding response regulator [Bordetella avium]RIQ14997.1 DNA-binding response regulator [Bordetella avium]RIQ18512.1 DNA-binding response regulator [Bordetella avium]RIQ35452.1 DNA-binding response regulator [Bordetella avium]